MNSLITHHEVAEWTAREQLLDEDFRALKHRFHCSPKDKRSHLQSCLKRVKELSRNVSKLKPEGVDLPPFSESVLKRTEKLEHAIAVLQIEIEEELEANLKGW